MKSFLIILFSGLISHNISGQDTTYYDNKWNKASTLISASYYKIVEPDKNDDDKAIERMYYKSGRVKSEISYISYHKNKKRHGKQYFWYENGNIQYEAYSENGKKNGPFISYWNNGQMKRKDLYKKGRFKKGECWDENGNKVKYYKFEILPKFPGGKEGLSKYISENFKYPPISYQNKLEGKVLVGFTIDETGNVTDVKVIEGINLELEYEAMRLVKNMPKWKPASFDGNPIKLERRLPIIFKIPRR